MTPGTLKDGEPHPAAELAKVWIASLPAIKLAMWLESFSSCAIEGNRTAEICGETLRRLLNSEPVSDRYVLGLAWYLSQEQDFHERFIEAIQSLMAYHIKEQGERGDTPEARLLLSVVTAIDKYEKVKFPFDIPSRAELEKFREDEAKG